ncbi:hypothetical protein [Sphingomonas sp.]|uniref:hypothetical protein n=1 Tax=Sphingomonas sp. TaxID=28214 RepID=UPI0035C87833
MTHRRGRAQPVRVDDTPPRALPHLTCTLGVGNSRAVDAILANPDLWREMSPPTGHTRPPPLDHASRDVAVLTPGCVRQGNAGNFSRRC